MSNLDDMTWKLVFDSLRCNLVQTNRKDIWSGLKEFKKFNLDDVMLSEEFGKENLTNALYTKTSYQMTSMHDDDLVKIR